MKIKGFLLVVLALVLFSHFVLADFSKTNALGQQLNDCEDKKDMILNPLYSNSVIECYTDDYNYVYNEAGFKGCGIVLADDDNTGDDCGLGSVGIGEILETGARVNSKIKYLGNWDWNEKDYGENQAEDAKLCFSRNIYAWAPYLCSDDSNWYACTKDSVGESITFKDKTTTFYCALDVKGQPAWVGSDDLGDFDADGDNVPDFADCRPNDDLSYGEFPKGCSTDDKITCIQEPAKEICGDGIDNNCDDVLDDCETNEKECTDAGFSFKEGQCCGNDGDKDVGIKTKDNTFICINKIESAVKDLKECKGDWCWLGADTNPNKIITIKNNDIVSDRNEWNICTQEGPLVSVAKSAIDKEGANRFYCYKNGNTYQYADCRPEDKATGSPENGIKERSAGDGLFNLKTTDGPAGQIDVVTTLYPLDFTGYKFLEFYAQFPEKPLTPAGITLKITGPQNTPYLTTNVFTHTENTPLLIQNKWYRFKVPVPELLNVQFISFESTIAANKINVKSVHLTKDGENPVCSGQSSSSRSSWLTSLDEWELGADITGKEVCNALFTENSWLQSKEGITELPGKNRCCGNTKGEYYSGNTDYGCWNSEAVAKNQRVTNVEIDIGYNEEITTFALPEPEKFTGMYTKLTPSGVADLGHPQSPYSQYNLPENTKSLKTLKELETKLEGQYYVEETNKLYSKTVQFGDNLPLQAEISLKDSPKEVGKVELKKNDFFNILTKKPQGEATISSENEKVDIYFTTEDNKKIEKITYDSFTSGTQTFLFMAELNDNYIVKTTSSQSPQSQTFTYTCFENTCEYPLPGKPPYTITNPHPSLYELAHKDNLGNTKPITKETTITTEGNIIASKVAQQVVHTDGNFYSCEIQLDQANKQPYCTKKGDFYCAYGKDGIVNTWATPKLDYYGYNLDSAEKKVGSVFTLKENTNDVILEHASNVLPGRNFLPNSEFNLQEHWFLSEGELSKQVEDGTFTLKANQLLTSERIPAPKNAEIYFSHNGTCSYNVILGYNNQDPVIEFNPTYNIKTEDASYVQIEFTGGECTITQPMLQVVEENEDPNSYENPSLIARAGAACCPDNSCWNGYACIQNMKDFTFLSEKTTKDFRCINGDWTALPIKKDWNEDQEGFCQKKEQCFVMPLEIDNNPTCVNETQYVFDHYCEKGNWTSRTKFLAGALLDSAPDEYTLYCTNPEDAFVSFSNANRQLILGDPQITTDQPKAAPGKETAPTTPVFTCLPKHPLIEDSENTCINNVCIIKTEDGTGFATSLNKNSFVESLNIDPKTLDACKGEGFVKCGDIYYNSDLNAITYGIDIEKGTLADFFDTVFSFFTDFFKDEQKDPKTFLEKGKNFNQIYLSNINDLQVRAINEKISKTEKVAIIEYEGFNTPICDYVHEKRISAPTSKELLQSTDFKVLCTTEGDVTKVQAQVAEDFFFTNLTGKLRQPIE